MKAITTILAIVFWNLAFSQLQTGLHYKIKNHDRHIKFFRNGSFISIVDNAPQILYTTNNLATTTQHFVCNRKLKATVTQNATNPAILNLDIWSISSSPTSCNTPTTINPSIQLDANHYYVYRITPRTSIGTPSHFISLRYSTFEFGVTTIPLKYRFGKKSDTISNETSVAVNAGFYVGYKWGRTRFFINKPQHNSLSFTLAAFASPMVIALSPATSRNKVTTTSNELGIGVGIACMFAYRDINVGILGGYDIPVSGESSKWNYGSRPWIGFGIGYKLAFLGAGK